MKKYRLSTLFQAAIVEGHADEAQALFDRMVVEQPDKVQGADGLHKRAMIAAVRGDTERVVSLMTLFHEQDGTAFGLLMFLKVVCRHRLELNLAKRLATQLSTELDTYVRSEPDMVPKNYLEGELRELCAEIAEWERIKESGG
jgi:hypothetical protein